MGEKYVREQFLNVIAYIFGMAYYRIPGDCIYLSHI